MQDHVNVLDTTNTEHTPARTSGRGCTQSAGVGNSRNAVHCAYRAFSVCLARVLLTTQRSHNAFRKKRTKKSDPTKGYAWHKKKRCWLYVPKHWSGHCKDPVNTSRGLRAAALRHEVSPTPGRLLLYCRASKQAEPCSGL